MDLQELRTAARLIDRLAKRALFAEKQMVALEGQCAEWRRIADELKAARNLTTATAESVIKERDALREDLRREEESHEETAQLLKTVDQKVRLLTQERDALRAECDDLRRVFLLVHGSLGIRQGEHIGNAIDALKKERDCANAERARHEAQSRSLVADVLRLTAEIERLKNPARQHPVKVGEYVKNDNGDVCQVHEVYAEYLLNTGWTWAFENCAPCDPPEATHITPEGKAVAESAAEDIRVGDMVEVFQKTSGETLFDDVSIRGTVAEVFWAETGNKCVRLDSSTMNRRSLGGSYFAYCDVRKIAKETAQAAVTPQPGDVVRLVRVPTQKEYPDWQEDFGVAGSTGCVVSLSNDCINVKYNGDTWEWPLSCVEVVKGGE